MRPLRRAGSGLIEAAGVDPNTISINSAGKALGVGGAFVAGPAWAIDYLVQRARPFVFSTAPPPAVADAIAASLRIVAAEPERRARRDRARAAGARAAGDGGHRACPPAIHRSSRFSSATTIVPSPWPSACRRAASTSGRFGRRPFRTAPPDCASPSTRGWTTRRSSSSSRRSSAVLEEVTPWSAVSS